MGERGELVEARQVAGLLRTSGGSSERRELALTRMHQLAARVCAGREPADVARGCAALRDAVLDLCENGHLPPSDARALCRAVDAAEAEAQEPYAGLSRALEAIDRACNATSADEIPKLALLGAPHADSAALFVEGELRAAEGLPLEVRAEAARGIAAQVARTGSPVEAARLEGARAVLALPVARGAALRIGSRSSFRFGEDEKRFLRALASRAGALLASSGEQESRLRHALRTFESLIETSPLPIISRDRNGNVQLWNRAAEELFGWRREEVMGKPAPFVQPGDEAEAWQILREALDGKVIRGRELRRVRRDGSMLDLSLSVAPFVDEKGGVAGSISIFADIGDRKRREAEVEQTARFREHLVGVVGHDLRNPLTAIVTSSQLLLRYAQLNERQSRVVGRIASSADRMARMIDDLLDFARSRLGGGFPIHPRRIDLRELCEHTVEELEFAFPARTVRFTAEGDLWGSWDPDRIAQAISNLVGNALQHGPEDGEVEVSLKAEPDDVILTTHNGGAPIPPEVLPHVFEPGRRGDSRSGGVGLGLYIVQQIVLAHGGSIEARSSPDDGTTFIVVLPRKGRKKV